MSDSLRRQLLFEVGERLFAADVRDVRGVRASREATPVPGSAPEVLGLINLRGSVVVAADLARALALPTSDGASSVFILFERAERRVALRVDRVLAVTRGSGGRPPVESDLLQVSGAPEAVAEVGEFDTRPFFRLDMDAVFARVLSPAGDRTRPERLATRGGRERR